MRSWIIPIAAFAVGAAGVFVAAAGLQLVVMVEFVATWPTLVAWFELGFGLGIAALGGALATEASWPRIPAALGLLGFVPIGGIWALWLAFHGVFSLAAFIVPGVAMLALILLAVAWVEVGKVAAEWVKANAEVGGFAGQRSAGIDLPMVGAGVVVVGGAAIIGLGGWIYATTDWPDRAWLAVRAVSLGVSPRYGPERVDFVGDSSALMWDPLGFYAGFESNLDGVDAGAVRALGDDLSTEVGLRLIADAGTGDPVEAERILWTDGHPERLPAWIAGGLRHRGAMRSPESLFRRSLDPELHVAPVTMHFGTTQLVVLFLEVARRLDLAMGAVSSPGHLYVRYDPPAGVDAAPLFVDVSAFDAEDGLAVDAVPKGFLIDEDYYPSGRGGTWASEDFASAAHYYEVMDQRTLADAIAANVVDGWKDEGHPEAEVPELSARVADSHEPSLIRALYADHLDAAKGALDADQLDVAVAEARAAAELRTTKGVLVWSMQPDEQLVLARAELALGDAEGAARDLASMLTYCADEGLGAGDDEDCARAYDLDAVLRAAP
jgi:hypothetical protein